MHINIAVYDTFVVLQIVQALTLLALLGIGGYRVLHKKPFTRTIKLWLLAIFTVNVLMAVTYTIIFTTYYIRHERPEYRQDNVYYSNQGKNK